MWYCQYCDEMIPEENFENHDCDGPTSPWVLVLILLAVAMLIVIVISI